MATEQGHPLGVTPTPEPGSARQAINEMIDAGLLDEVMDRVDAGGLTLTGEGGFLPEMIKAVLERGLQCELTGHALIQNLRRGHYELGVEVDPSRRLAAAFTELANAI